jgi:hypothetical protein
MLTSGGRGRAGAPVPSTYLSSAPAPRYVDRILICSISLGDQTWSQENLHVSTLTMRKNPLLLATTVAFLGAAQMTNADVVYLALG